MLDEKKIEFMSEIHNYQRLKNKLEYRNNLEQYKKDLLLPENERLWHDDEIMNHNDVRKIYISYKEFKIFDLNYKDKVKEIAFVEPKRSLESVVIAVDELVKLGSIKHINIKSLTNIEAQSLIDIWVNEVKEITKDMTEKEFKTFVNEVKTTPNGIWEVAKLYEIKKGMK